MKIVTWNLRSVYIGDGINGFIHRAGMICKKILDEKPEVIAFQEVIEATLPVMERMLPEYLFTGHFRNADYGGEGVFTAIRKDCMQMLGSEVIWMSDTPYEAGSRFEVQSPCPRVCLMTQLRCRETGKIFRVFNLHLDHESEEARVKGIQCALNFVKEYNDKKEFPLFIMGDFNASPKSDVHKICGDFGGLSELTGHIENTFHNYGGDVPEEFRKIDYIYVSDELKTRVKKTEAWEDEIDGIYLSDHYPICTELDM